MNVLVCGARIWTDRERIHKELSALPDDTTIIHGAARGADTIAGEEARTLGFHVIECPADWATHGRAAGPLRNAAMLLYVPSLVIAFTANIRGSKGTRDMVKRARAAGLPVWLCDGRRTIVLSEKNEKAAGFNVPVDFRGRV